MNKFLQIWNMESKCLPLGVHRHLQGHKSQKENQIYNLFCLRKDWMLLARGQKTLDLYPNSNHLPPPPPPPLIYALCLKIKMKLCGIQFVAIYESFEGFDLFYFFTFICGAPYFICRIWLKCTVQKLKICKKLCS